MCAGTLGFFRPRQIKRLLIEDDSASWTEAQLQILRQQHLFRNTPTAEPEKVPYKFKYEFVCDHDQCQGHTVICTDWEMGQSWRAWRESCTKKTCCETAWGLRRTLTWSAPPRAPYSD